MTMHPLTMKALSVLNLVLLMACPFAAAAEQSETPSAAVGKKKKDIAPEYDLYLEAGFEYSDNVYGLSKSQRTMYNDNEEGDKTSGRFKHMDSLSDFMFQTRLGFKFKKKFPACGDFLTAVWLKYNHCVDNEKRSYPEGRLRIEQEILDAGKIGIEGSFLCGFFKKNYLAGAGDSDGNGNINKFERNYSSAIYDEYEGFLRYEYDYRQGKKKRQVFSLDVQPCIGGRFRKYNSVFGNRNQDILVAGISLDIGILSFMTITPSYYYERIFCRGLRELILFDENSTGTDINSDSDLDNNAALITRIDRSCHRHIFEITTSFCIRQKATFYLGFKSRTTTYITGNRLDIDRHGQTEDYRQNRTGIKFDFTRDWSLSLEWTNTAEEDADSGNSIENRFSMSTRYCFL